MRHDTHFWEELSRYLQKVFLSRLERNTNNSHKEVKEVGVINSFIIDVNAKHQEAVSNQNFLGTLEGPVKEIHIIAMENLRELFKNIFVFVFVIWKNSKYYSSP